MRQRAALARVLAQEAHIVLMDEPFAALDAMTRDPCTTRSSGIWAELELTVVFVTHNVREAVRLSDRTVLYSSSRPGQGQSPVSIFPAHGARRPARRRPVAASSRTS